MAFGFSSFPPHFQEASNCVESRLFGRNVFSGFWVWLLCLAVSFQPSAQAGVGQTVPMMKVAPTVDGEIESSEWEGALRMDGLTTASGPDRGILERREATVWIGATEGLLHIALRSQLPAEGELTVDSRPEDPPGRMFYDDSLEIWLDPTPDEPEGTYYRLVVNSEGRSEWSAWEKGSGEKKAEVAGEWEAKGSFQDGFWDWEISIPLETLAPGRRATEGVWGINVCRNWKEPWVFSSLNTSGDYVPTERFTFTEASVPVVAFEKRGDAFAGEIENVLVLSNPGSDPLELSAGFVLTSDTMPEVVVEETVRLEPGDTREIPLEVQDPVTAEFRQEAWVGTADGRDRFFDRKTRWKSGEHEWVWTTTPHVPTLPLDFHYAVYPYSNTLRLRADLSALPREAELTGLEVTVRGKDGAVVATESWEPGEAEGPPEMILELPELEGEYEVALLGLGEGVPDDEVVKAFERKRFPWENNPMGRSTKVYPPFTPIEVAEDTLSTVLREHVLNAAGLWDQVTATSAETEVAKSLLAAPMRWEVVTDGEKRTVEAGKLEFIQKADHEVVTEAEFRAGALSAGLKNTWDYDGTMRVDLTLGASGGETVDALTLVIPLREEAVTLYHAMGDSLRWIPRVGALPEGEGTVWDALDLEVKEMPSNFCTYILLGNANRALSWFAENDAGWSWDPATPNVEVVRVDGEVQLRVHLINQPVVIEEPRTITFGLLAAPVKPRLGEDWRHRWRRDNFMLLGTNINWLSMGHGGDFYPPGKDLWFWHMLRKGNQERVSDELIQEVIDRGLPYVEPYGDRYIDRWERHVRHNMRSRLGGNLVFYYNRASHQFAEEFQTFKDEWILTDFRSVGPGDRLWEIRIVPTESYIDMALYWYAKSFEHGGNLGVYWDNWFFKPSFNTWSTAAYEQPDGTIFPSTGLWGLRELAKRTFVMMNELGMEPIVMAHMTGTNILPMLSFVTVQYDWEWKMQERFGDVQERHAREYILAATTGELAGTWPVRLGIKSREDWLWRTYTAVGIVHELDMSQVHERIGLFEVIDGILEEPGVVAYRYWDERPQPVVADHPDLPSIVYSVPGKRAVFAVTSYIPEDTTAQVSIDAGALGFADGFRITDAETGEEIPFGNGAATFPLKKHDIRIFEITP